MSRRRRVLTVIAALLGGGLALGALLGAATVQDNLRRSDRFIAAAFRAGMVERQAVVDGHRVNYAEGPASGPALLLIHGQSTDWKNYAPALPELTKRYHVYAVDVFGHGGSDRVPELYNAVRHGRALARFAEQVVGGPYLLSGHSSGGHLAAWLAANDPEVRCVLLDDPPFFTTALPRARTTWNYVSLATMAHEFLASGERDWVVYSAERDPFWQFFGDGAEWFKQQGRDYYAAHPQQGYRYWAMPPAMNEGGRAMRDYDPRFGDAFYTASWDEGFDQAATLAAIRVPATLIHTKVQEHNGILLAAMGAEEAERARSLIPDVHFHRTSTGHDWHWADAPDFVRQLDDLRRRCGG